MLLSPKGGGNQHPFTSQAQSANHSGSGAGRHRADVPTMGPTPRVEEYGDGEAAIAVATPAVPACD